MEVLGQAGPVIFATPRCDAFELPRMSIRKTKSDENDDIRSGTDPYVSFVVKETVTTSYLFALSINLGGRLTLYTKVAPSLRRVGEQSARASKLDGRITGNLCQFSAEKGKVYVSCDLRNLQRSLGSTVLDRLIVVRSSDLDFIDIKLRREHSVWAKPTGNYCSFPPTRSNR